MAAAGNELSVRLLLLLGVSQQGHRHPCLPILNKDEIIHWLLVLRLMNDKDRMIQ